LPPTHVQAHLFAQELTLRHAADNPEKLTRALVEARADLNPHQVDAALFAFANPVSKGAILADEVGLGKTIEAGLVATQLWAEGRRHILVLCPASLRTQWRDELQEKFYLPSVILDARAAREDDQLGRNPFERPTGETAVVIASFHFAARRQEQLMTVPWDLAIIDEAHRLRSVYKGARIATAIRAALSTTPKILLTATPLQNSLLELYGLVSFVDETAFGDQRTFRNRYARVGQAGERFEELKARLAPLCHRTLRRQVVEYVSYTNRQPFTQAFHPSEAEQDLYEMVSEYLRRDELLGLPNAQRALITLVLRKLLASSTFAIAGALGTMVARLRAQLTDLEKRAENGAGAAAGLVEELAEDDLDGALGPDDLAEIAEGSGEGDPPTPLELALLRQEIEELETFRDLAEEITENAKGGALLSALKAVFDEAGRRGTPRKAVIFTESRRTQDYLMRHLAANGYDGRVVRFSGTNNDEAARTVYERWRTTHAGSDRVTGSRDVDIRAALVDEFRTNADVMIATEAAAEGINLQFCSVVVNYDLPWNPQRVEQRIGRCHRYGQRNDVVVVNFLNQANAADQRVFELLSEKFRLFEGVFGASDEVLGVIESGVDIERRIGDILQRCRTVEEIDRDFEQLQLEFSESIDAAMADTRAKLIEHFDAQVHDRLKVRLDSSRGAVDRHQELLFGVMRYALGADAVFDHDARTIDLVRVPAGVALTTPRHYTVARPEPDEAAYHLRPSDPLAEWALARSLRPPPEGTHLTFHRSTWSVRAVELDPLAGRDGVMRAAKMTVAGQSTEEYLLLVAATDGGAALTDDQVRRLLMVPATADIVGTSDPGVDLDAALAALEAERRAEFEERKARWIGGEYDKLDRWAQDERDRLRGEVDEIKGQIREVERAIRAAGTEADKLTLRRRKHRLDGALDEARHTYDDASTDIRDRQEAMLDQIEASLGAEHSTEILFTCTWSVR